MSFLLFPFSPYVNSLTGGAMILYIFEHLIYFLLCSESCMLSKHLLLWAFVRKSWRDSKC